MLIPKRDGDVICSFAILFEVAFLHVDGFDALLLLAILVTDFPTFPARFPSDLPNNWFAIDFGLELRWLRDGGNAGVRLSR